jgi:uncharacterized protein DUF6062
VTLEVVDALALRGCPVCSALDAHERRYVSWFWEGARGDAEVRARFSAAGGFCRRHAWMLHDHLVGLGSSRAVADLYRPLVAADLAQVEALLAALGVRRRPRRRPRDWPRRREPCLACADLRRAEPRKAAMLVDALAVPEARTRYAASDGPCADHLATLVEEAAGAEPEVARFLLRDWQQRLQDLQAELSDHLRRRDVRWEGPSGRGRQPLTDVLRRYSGGRPGPRHGAP